MGVSFINEVRCGVKSYLSREAAMVVVGEES